MQESEIYQRLSKIFSSVFDDDSIVVTSELTADDVPEWDSFNHINLIVAVEQAFKIKFQTAELEQMKNVGHLVELIEKKVNKA
jgi:acyl carrier protein